MPAMVVALRCRSSCSGWASVRCAPPMSTSTRSRPSVTVHWNTPQFRPRWARMAASRTSSQDAGFFAALDDDQRDARRQQRLQFSGGGEVGGHG